MAGWAEESDMTSFILIAAFLSIPMSLSFLALIEMSRMQESELVRIEPERLVFHQSGVVQGHGKHLGSDAA